MPVPILGQSPSVPSAPELTAEQQDALAAMAKEHPPAEADTQPPNCTTVFQVAIGLDGAVIAVHDLSFPLIPQRGATPDDMYGACSVVLKDLLAQQTAQSTQQVMTAYASAMQQKMQEQDIRRRLNV